MGRKGWFLKFFFIESKLFQLVVEEGGNFFSLKIFEWGKILHTISFCGQECSNLVNAEPRTHRDWSQSKAALHTQGRRYCLHFATRVKLDWSVFISD